MMNTNAGKVTKREYFEILKEMVETSERADTEELIGFIDHELELLTAKADKAKERAAKSKEKGDELRGIIFNVLTTSYQTVDAITAQIEVEDITRAKVVSRLSQLVKFGQAEKEQVKDETGRKVMAYKLV